MDFHSLTRRELQTLCKKNGIPANITNVAMADSLKALHTNVQGIEDPSDCLQSLTAQSGVESPERSELTSSRVPRTRSIRKKVETDTVVNQTMSGARRTTKNLNSGFAADEKDTIAPINIDVQFSEVQNKKISISKEAGIPQTPSMVSNTRKRAGKGETTAKTYGTRRSTRLAAKTQEDTSDAANMKLFSADGGDNYEMSINESCPDLSEDVQSTVSHSKVVSEPSKCEEMTSSYSGVEIQHDLGSGFDSTKDCERIIEMVIPEMPEEENKGDDFHEQSEVENNDVVIAENGDDIHEQSKVENNDEAIVENADEFYEEPEVEMKDEVTAENGDCVTKQPDTETIAEVAAESSDEFYEEPEVEMKDEVSAENGDCVTKQPDTETIAEVAAESQNLNGENDELIDNGDVLTGGVMNCLTDNGDIIAGGNDHEYLNGENDDLNDNGENDDLNDNGEDAATGDVMNCLTDNGDILAEPKDHDAENLIPEMNDLTLGDNGDMIVEAQGHVAGDTLVVVDKCDMIVETEGHAACDTRVVEELVTECEKLDADLVTESEMSEADVVTESKEKEADVVTESKEKEADVVTQSEEEKADVVTVVAEEPLCDEPSQEILGDEDASKAHIDSQIIFVDDGIVLPVKDTSAANPKMIDNPNVLVGKENSVQYSFAAKEDNQQNKELDPAEWSIRKLKKQLKHLSLDSNKKKGSSVKLDEDLGTAPRAALKTLPENQQF